MWRGTFDRAEGLLGGPLFRWHYDNHKGDIEGAAKHAGISEDRYVMLIARRPKALRAKIGSVTVPEPAPEAETPQKPAEAAKESSEHSQIQWLLAKLGVTWGWTSGLHGMIEPRSEWQSLHESAKTESRFASPV